MMAVVAARELADGEVVFVGIGLPNLACNLARATHAPRLVLIYESGAVGAIPERLPVSIGDPALVTGSLMVCSMADVFQLFLQHGRIEVGFLGGAQVDRYGNINTTVIGAYDHPSVRLPGAGGAAEIAVHAGRTLIIAKLNPRAFPERVDFVTSPGQRCAGRPRRELGLPGAGPVKVITDKAILEADHATGEMTLAALYPGVTPAEVQAGVGWPLAGRPRIGTISPPATNELRLLREVLDPKGLYLKAKAMLLLACTLAASRGLLAQRAPVLKQVAVPHAYYWREMYVPQATSGPSAATWSPDGTELIYSMQGSLWRQRIGSRVARQLTGGEGYDYQPDWSPDGRLVVFARYASDAIELELLDLGTQAVRAITSNGAVNVEPRWSPDGTRIAFVSTTFNGRWHIFTVAMEGATPGDVTRLTEDNDSRLPRYYYSVWDHYLSPTWSPDGRELILISNRGHIHGTGGMWRMTATPGAPMREIHYEETTWKARPDWAPDGARVVYSSYLGRQWNQLWLMTSEGGDPFPLTYGDFDATAPRWSHDGKHIAYISNEAGNTALWVIDVPGAARRPIVAAERRYRGPVGRLRVAVVDGAGRPLAARVSVTGTEGRGLSYAPDDAWRQADEAFDRNERGFEYGYFHTTGNAELTVPAGNLRVEAWQGPEYRVARRDVRVASRTIVTARLVLERLADLPALGWWSGDLHVHMNYGGAYRNTPEHLVFQARAEGLHVLENLVVNKEQRIPDIAYFRTTPDPASGPGLLLVHDQEYHTSYWGHTGLLGLRDHYLVPEYAGYPNTAAASLYPMNADVADMAHAQGALFGYVHPFDTQPDPADTTQPLTSELPVDAALGKVDYVEVMGYSNHLITSGIWYRLLNCGFRLPAGAGTDAFPNFASLRGPPGLVRVFVHSGATLSRAGWMAGLKAGRTFVTNAPLLEFSLGGREIGDEIRLSKGTRLTARVRVRSSVPIDHVEVIGNGVVVATIPLRDDRLSASDSVSIPVTHSGWFVLRAWADRSVSPILDLYPFASTSPIYVRVGRQPVRSREDAEFFLRWIDRLVQAAEAYDAWNTPGEREHVLQQLAHARAVYADQAGPPSPNP